MPYALFTIADIIDRNRTFNKKAAITGSLFIKY